MRALRVANEIRACLMSVRWRKPHKLAVMAIFKNESHVLSEWDDHYLHEGASLIHLINNNSTDDFAERLTPYTKTGIVRLFHDQRLHAQRTIYNEHLQILRQQCEWLLTCDLDEFVYGRGNHTRVIDVLNQVSPWVSSIQIPWKMFGSPGHIEQPSAGVLASFTQRANTNNLTNHHPCMPAAGLIAGKGVARCSRIRNLDVHSCSLT